MSRYVPSKPTHTGCDAGAPSGRMERGAMFGPSTRARISGVSSMGIPSLG
jgi:hypothetical protein